MRGCVCMGRWVVVIFVYHIGQYNIKRHNIKQKPFFFSLANTVYRHGIQMSIATSYLERSGSGMHKAAITKLTAGRTERVRPNNHILKSLLEILPFFFLLRCS